MLDSARAARAPVRRAALADWVAAYERAWRAPATEALGALFTAGASYRAAPFADPIVGLAAIAAFWEAERAPGERFELRFEVVAIEGPVGVARVEVRYTEPRHRIYRDLWIVTLEPDGRAAAFEEWPFFPERPRVAEG